MAELTPDASTDRLYLSLKGARERLCVAQTVLRIMGRPKHDIERLGVAITQIDLIGTDICRQQWSEHDYPTPYNWQVGE